MTALRSYFLLILLLIAAGVSPAFSQLRPAVEDAVIQKVSKSYTLRANGDIEFRHYKKVFLQSHFAFHRLYGETFIVYNPQYQTLKIHECYTLMADGKKVVAPANAFNKVLPRFAAGAPAYNHLVEMVVTHTGLEVGATIVLDYSLLTKKGYFPAMTGMEALADNAPTEEWDLSVTLPEKDSLQFRMYHIQGDPQVTRKGSTRNYMWRFSQVLSYLPETGQPDDSYFQPYIVFSTASGLESVMKTLTSQAAFRYETSEPMRKWIRTVATKDMPDLKKVLSLQERLVKDVGLYGVPVEHTGYKPRTAIETFKSNGGTEFEKAILLTAWYKELGFEARPVAMFRGYLDNALGILDGWNRTLVQVTLKEEGPLLVSVTQTDDQDIMAIPTDFLMLPLDASSPPVALRTGTGAHKIGFTGKFTLSENNECTGDLIIIREGRWSPWLRWYRDASKAASGVSGSIKSADLSNVRVKINERQHAEAIANVMNKEAAKQEKDFYFFEWPSCTEGITAWHWTDLIMERINPLWMTASVHESYTYSMEIPQGWTLQNPIYQLDIKNLAGNLRLGSRQEGSQVFYYKSLTLDMTKKGMDPLEYYTQMRELLGFWQAETFNVSIISKAKQGN